MKKLIAITLVLIMIIGAFSYAEELEAIHAEFIDEETAVEDMEVEIEDVESTGDVEEPDIESIDIEIAGDSLAETNATFGVFEYLPMDDGTCEIRHYTGNGGAVTIPNKCDGYTVVAISEGAFLGNDAITSVTIPDSVELIGREAFRNCKKMKAVKLGSKLKTIEDYAFADCPNLVEIINTYTFDLETIGSYAFYGCSSLRILDINYFHDLVSIGEYAFAECDSLKSIDLPTRIEQLGEGAFYSCAMLQTISLPLIMKEIPKFCFSNCSRLENIFWGGIKTIGYEAFSKCDSLKSIELPSLLETVQSAAFASCMGLKSVKILGAVNSIQDDAFCVYDDKGAVISPIIPDLVVLCYRDSYAEMWAMANGAKYTAPITMPELKKVKSAKKKMTVTWGKDTDATAGYEIQYSLLPDFTDAKSKIVKSAKTTKLSIGKLKSKKVYYVRIRKRKKIDSAIAYSPWSNTLNAKIK